MKYIVIPLYVLNRWDSGSNVGEFDGHSKRVLSCAFKPTRPFRIVTCGEDFLVNFYEGPPFKFKQSLRFVVVFYCSLIKMYFMCFYNAFSCITIFSHTSTSGWCS